MIRKNNDTMDVIARYGVCGVRFDSDTGKDGFFILLSQLLQPNDAPGISKDLESTRGDYAALHPLRGTIETSQSLRGSVTRKVA